MSLAAKSISVIVLLSVSRMASADLVVEVGDVSVALSSLGGTSTQIVVPVEVSTDAELILDGFNLYFDLLYNGRLSDEDDPNDITNNFPSVLIPFSFEPMPSRTFTMPAVANTAFDDSPRYHDIQLQSDSGSVPVTTTSSTLLFKLLIDLGPASNFSIGDMVTIQNESPFGRATATDTDNNSFTLSNNSFTLSLVDGSISVVPEPSAFFLVLLPASGWLLAKRNRWLGRLTFQRLKVAKHSHI